MAGGEGKRLRPLSVNKPKPMVELLDRSILEHIIELLTANGITEACLTLKYLPQIITNHFGNGDKYGIRLDMRIEKEALGTAGGVLNCADFIGQEDFLVISGDCVCDFDLNALMAYHREKEAEVTMALYCHEEPCEYGLVVTEDGGRITRFIEKPSWDRVLTDRINTGVYVISPHILKEIPIGKPYDFGRDMFPKLLSEGRRLFGFIAEGYWCDIGSTAAYLKCCQDVLQGIVRINPHAPEITKGVWSLSQLPEGVTINPPVYIGKNAVIDRGATIGPLAVIGASTIVASGAAISRSVISGALINEKAVLDGTVVCKGASIGRGATLGEGSVLGENCIVGEGCIISPGARIWPGRQLPAGSVVSGTVMSEEAGGGFVFKTPGIVSGVIGSVLTVDVCLKLGEVSGENKRVGVGWNGGEAARVLAEAFGCGVCAAGGDLFRFDGGFSSCASYAALLFNLPLTVFIEESCGSATITFFGQNGGCITRDLERKMEMALLEPHQMSPGQTGQASTVTGVCDAYAAAAAHSAFACMENDGHLTVAVPGGGAQNRALRSALSLMNCAVVDRKSGAPSFEVKHGGATVSALDEEGYRLSDNQLKAIAAYVELSCGASEIAVPYDAPSVFEIMARDFGATILRVGRDGQRAEDVYLRQMVIRDGIFTVTRVCAWLIAHNERLANLRRRVPSFSTITREVVLEGSRGAAMRLMSSCCTGMAAEITSGLRLDTDRGRVYISPMRGKRALKIHAESMNEEAAEELCVEFERRVHDLDQK